MQFNDIMETSSLIELTAMVFNMRLTHLGLEASICMSYVQLKNLTRLKLNIYKGK